MSAIVQYGSVNAYSCGEGGMVCVVYVHCEHKVVGVAAVTQQSTCALSYKDCASECSVFIMV